MPIIKSAKKKMRQDKKRNKKNTNYLKAYREAIRKLKKSATSTKINDFVKKAYSAIDKAVKKRVIHKNKAGRLKSNVAKFLKQKKIKSKK